MTWTQIALALSILGMVGVGVILSMSGVTLYTGRVHFRNIRWRLSWWASWASFLVGIALSTFSCGSPANDLASGIPWLRINRVLCLMLHTPWRGEA